MNPIKSLFTKNPAAPVPAKPWPTGPEWMVACDLVRRAYAVMRRVEDEDAHLPLAERTQMMRGAAEDIALAHRIAGEHTWGHEPSTIYHTPGGYTLDEVERWVLQEYYRLVDMDKALDSYRRHTVQA